MGVMSVAFGKQFAWNLRHRFFGRELRALWRQQKVTVALWLGLVTLLNVLVWGNEIGLWRL